MAAGKKARGRQKRAMKEARAADLRSLWEPTILRNKGVDDDAASSCDCEHLALFPEIPQGGPAVSFMNYIASEGVFANSLEYECASHCVELCVRSVLRFPKVREEESERSLATDLLLRFARNVFFHDLATEGDDWFYYRNAQQEVAICNMIYALELLGTYSDRNVVTRRAFKMNNKLASGNRRDAVKFVAKRLPCICLKKLHSAVRMKVAKVGKCTGCHKRFPRSELLVCTGCMITDYCSKECQRANWSIHKRLCGYSEVMSRDLPADYVLRYD